MLRHWVWNERSHGSVSSTKIVQLLLTRITCAQRETNSEFLLIFIMKVICYVLTKLKKKTALTGTNYNVYT